MIKQRERERSFLLFFIFPPFFCFLRANFLPSSSLRSLLLSFWAKNNNDEKRHTFLRKTSSTTHLANNNKKKRKMEVEEEHEVLRAVRRNAERLSSSSSNDDNIDDNKDNAEAISSCLRSLRAHFCRGGGQKGKKKRDEVSAKDCLRVRGGFVFCNCFFMNARALSSILFLSLRRTGTVSLSRDVRQSQSQTRAEKTHATRLTLSF